ILLGLARCAGCGRTLKVVRRKRADGSDVPSYYCKDQATEQCLDRAFVHAKPLEEFVTEWFEDQLRHAPKLIDVVAAGRELAEAQTERERANEELAAYLLNTSASLPGYKPGLERRQADLEAAEERVHELSAHVTRLPSGGSLVEVWPRFETPGRRRV